MTEQRSKARITFLGDAHINKLLLSWHLVKTVKLAYTMKQTTKHLALYYG